MHSRASTIEFLAAVEFQLDRNYLEMELEAPP